MTPDTVATNVRRRAPNLQHSAHLFGRASAMDRLAAARTQALLLAAWVGLAGVAIGTQALANPQSPATPRETPQADGDAAWLDGATPEVQHG